MRSIISCCDRVSPSLFAIRCNNWKGQTRGKWLANTYAYSNKPITIRWIWEGDWNQKSWLEVTVEVSRKKYSAPLLPSFLSISPLSHHLVPFEPLALYLLLRAHCASLHHSVLVHLPSCMAHNSLSAPSLITLSVSSLSMYRPCVTLAVRCSFFISPCFPSVPFNHTCMICHALTRTVCLRFSAVFTS